MNDGDYPDLVEVDPKHYVLASELAQGGMGRIRVARDRRLGRTVALKEILTARADVAQRFEREARITARLEHPAIVSVHEAGAWPSGEPFIAMRLVRGRSFDEVIAEAKTRAERIALLPNVLAVADAIAYAHEQRIIHRDLKPKNVLVGKFGETVVIDWGLAKDLSDLADEPARSAPRLVTEGSATPLGTQPGFASGDVPNESAPPITGTEQTLGSEPPPGASQLTVMGAVMGTPAYMPPEQARGAAVGTEADVYAIGALLYHALSGAPPIRSTTIEKALEDAIAHRIVPLADVDPELPPDLLAIANKAMARDAADRYPSARELADDLRRFQTGQLVGAHRYSVRQLIGKWIRRHRAAAGVAATAALVLAVVGVIAVRRIVEEREDAEAQRVLAEQSRADAEALVGFMLGDTRQQLEQLGRLDVLDAITKRVLTYYDRPDLAVEQQGKRAAALMTRGAVLEAQGKLAEGTAPVRVAISVRSGLVANEPHVAQWSRDLAASHRKLSDMLRKQGDLEGALVEARTALAVVEAAAARVAPDRELHRELAGAHKKVGDVLRARGDKASALVAFEASLAIRKQIAAADPNDLEAQRDLAINTERIGTLLREQGDLPGALARYRAALTVAQAAANRDAGTRERRRDVSILHARIGDVLLEQQDLDGALAAYRAAHAIPVALASEHPQNVQYQRDLSIGHTNVARVLLAKGDHAGALVELRNDLAIAKRLAEQDPTNAEWQRDLSISLETIADALLDAKQPAAALVELEASLAIAKRLAERDATNQRFRADLAKTYDKLAQVHTSLGNRERAAAAVADAARLR